MKAKKLFRLPVLGAMIVLVSCASIVSKSQYPVTITSDPDGADITIVDENGMTIHTGTTPTTVTLSTGGNYKGKDYTVTFLKPGYEKYQLKLQRGIDGWYVGGNFLLGGLIGWLIVDPITGAMWTLPKEVTATLIPLTAHNGPFDSINFTTVDQLSPELTNKLIRIN